MATYLPNVTDVFPSPVIYTPDYAFMDKMLRRRQAMYEQGFSQVASKYQFLNSEMTNPANIKFRDEFMRQAVKNLKGLSTMDLSIPQNVNEAVGVFTPFYQNQNALSDLAFTRHINSEYAKGEAFMQKEGGKYYNPTSLQYLRMFQEAYRNDDVGNAQKYLQNKPSYMPYADYSKKFIDALDKIKPNIIERSIPLNNGYMKETKLSSYDIQSIKDILEATLSPQEKEQLRLEGIVQKASQLTNPAAAQQLFTEYAAHATDNIKGIDAKISEIKVKRDLSRKKEDRDKYDALIQGYEDRKRSIDSNLQNFNAADNFQKRMYLERLAGNVYLDDKLSEFAFAKSKTDNIDSKKLTNDQAYWNAYEAARKDREEKEKKEKDLLANSFQTLNASDKEKLSVGHLETKISQINDQINLASNSIIKQHLLSSANYNAGVTEKHVSQFIKDWESKSKNIEEVVRNGRTTYQYRDSKKELTPLEYQDYKAWNNYTKQVSDLEIERQSYLTMQANLEAEVKTKGKANYEKLDQLARSFNGGKNITFTAPDGKEFSYTPSQFVKKLQDKSIDIKNVQFDGSQYGAPPAITTELIIDGKSYKSQAAVGMYSPSDPTSQFVNGFIKKYVQPANQDILMSDPAKAIEKLRKEIYESNVINNRTIQQYNVTSDGYKVLEGVLKAKLPNASFTINGEDTKTGETIITFDDKKSYTEEDITKILGGLETVTELPGNRYAIRGIDGRGLLSKLSSSETRLYSALTNPYKGTQVDPNSYIFDLPPLRVDGTPYSIIIRRMLYEYATQNNGLKSQDYQYMIFDKDNPQLNLFERPFDNAAEVVRAVSTMNQDPKATKDLIERHRAASLVE